MEGDKHLIISWNDKNQKFNIDATGNPTFVEAVGVLELAKITLFSNQTVLNNSEEEEMRNEKKKSD